MKTKPSLGTGRAGVFAHAVAAGIIASSSGSASAACAPFRNVRLGIAFFVMIMMTSSFENGVLVTMPRISDEKRYPSFPASRTILRTAGAS